MKKIILLSFLISFNANAQIDSSIYNNVGNYSGQQRAYQMPTYQQPEYQAPIQVKQIDYNCMNPCTSAGYQYGFCASKCSY